MENPKCPYCGGEMKYDFNDDLETHWLYCPKCGARSSVVPYDDDPYAAAMKRDRAGELSICGRIKLYTQRK